VTAEASGASLWRESNAAKASGAWAAAQTAEPLELQQAAARTQRCCAIAVRVVCGDAVRQVIPQEEPANGATVSSKTSANTRWARRSTGTSVASTVSLARAPVEMTIVRVWSCLVRQLTVAVQQLHDGEDEEPEA
jgi:hypothetical protein